jgi:hypothetical protein
MDADEEKLILYEKAEVFASLYMYDKDTGIEILIDRTPELPKVAESFLRNMTNILLNLYLSRLTGQ